MTGINNYIIRQDKKLVADTVQEHFMITAGEVRSSDTFPEEYITPHQQMLVFMVKTNASGRMSRCEQNLESIFSENNSIAFIEEQQGTLIIFKRQPPHFPRRRSKCQKFFFVGMKVQIKPVCFVDKLVPEYVIEMAMCV